MKAKIFSGVLSFTLLLLGYSSVKASPAFSQAPIDFEGISEEAVKKEELDIEKQKEFDDWAIKHTKRVFNWNHISSVVIFFVVHIVIFLGLYFSYIQFKHSVNNKTIDRSPSTVKVGHSGIEVSSSIIGLLILVISLAFFYLYLENVYPVKTTHLPQETSSESE